MTLHEKLDILLAGNDYKKDIIEAFKYSDLNLTEDMAWNEIITKLETIYPNWEYLIYGGTVYATPSISGSIPSVGIVDGTLTSTYGGNDGQTTASFNTPLHAKAGDILRITYKFTNTSNPGRRINFCISSSSSHSGDLLNITKQGEPATRTTYEYVVTKDTDVYVRFIFAYCSAYISEIYLMHM